MIFFNVLLSVFIALPFSAVAIAVTQVLVSRGRSYLSYISIYHCTAAISKLLIVFNQCFVSVSVLRSHCTISTIWFLS